MFILTRLYVPRPFGVGRYSYRPADGLYHFLAVLAAILLPISPCFASPIRDEVKSVVAAQFATETPLPDLIPLVAVSPGDPNALVADVTILPRINPETIIAVLARIPTSPFIWLASLLPWAWIFVLWNSTPPRKRIRERRRRTR